MAQRFVSMWSKMPFSTALHTSKNDMCYTGLQDSAIFHPVFWALSWWFTMIYQDLFKSWNGRFTIAMVVWTGLQLTTGGWNWKYLRQARSGPGICGVCARGMASYLSCWEPLDLSVPKQTHDTRSLQIRSKIVFRLKDWNWFGASRILPGQHRAASYLARRTGINTSCHENIKPRWHKPRGWPGIHIDPCRLLTLLVRCIQCRDGVHMAVPGILRQNPGRGWRDPQAESGDLSNLFSWYYTLSRGLSIHISIRARRDLSTAPQLCDSFSSSGPTATILRKPTVCRMPTKNSRKQQTKTSTEQMWQPINPPQWASEPPPKPPQISTQPRHLKRRARLEEICKDSTLGLWIQVLGQLQKIRYNMIIWTYASTT